VIGFSIAVIGLALALVLAMGALREERERGATLSATLDSLRAAVPPASGDTLSAADRALRDDLVEHRELIPFPAVMGGTMFFVPQRIVILNDRWAYAEFEDGHIGGSMLLEYDVDDGRIRWKRLAARRD
jgi:hypothetical protein